MTETSTILRPPHTDVEGLDRELLTTLTDFRTQLRSGSWGDDSAFGNRISGSRDKRKFRAIRDDRMQGRITSEQEAWMVQQAAHVDDLASLVAFGYITSYEGIQNALEQAQLLNAAVGINSLKTQALFALAIHLSGEQQSGVPQWPMAFNSFAHYGREVYLAAFATPAQLKDALEKVGDKRLELLLNDHPFSRNGIKTDSELSSQFVREMMRRYPELIVQQVSIMPDVHEANSYTRRVFTVLSMVEEMCPDYAVPMTIRGIVGVSFEAAEHLFETVSRDTDQPRPEYLRYIGESFADYFDVHKAMEKPVEGQAFHLLAKVQQYEQWRGGLAERHIESDLLPPVWVKEWITWGRERGVTTDDEVRLFGTKYFASTDFTADDHKEADRFAEQIEVRLAELTRILGITSGQRSLVPRGLNGVVSRVGVEAQDHLNAIQHFVNAVHSERLQATPRVTEMLDHIQATRALTIVGASKAVVRQRNFGVTFSPDTPTPPAQGR